MRTKSDDDVQKMNEKNEQKLTKHWPQDQLNDEKDRDKRERERERENDEDQVVDERWDKCIGAKSKKHKKTKTYQTQRQG